MHMAGLVLEYLRVLIWPIVVLIVLIMFQDQWKTIVLRIRRAELPGGVSLDFQEDLREAKNSLEGD